MLYYTEVLKNVHSIRVDTNIEVKHVIDLPMEVSIRSPLKMCTLLEHYNNIEYAIGLLMEVIDCSRTFYACSIRSPPKLK